jgi:hypothetical protein
VDDGRHRDPDREQLAVLLDLVQDGVVARRQLVELGVRDHDVKRMLRRKELVRVPHHRGVFVNHTGPLSWEQRAWAAVLVHWPAALARESALPRPAVGGPIHVAIAPGRTVVPVPRVLTHRTPDFASKVDWRKAPPRISLEHAAIDVASCGRADVAGVFRMLTDVCHTRATDAARIATVLATRRVAGRHLVAEMLDDIATGACSVLERGYLLRVERAHGLPVGRRQKPARAGGAATERDVEYEDYGLLVELDGLAFHSGARARDQDAWRDLAARVGDDLTTVRLTYGLVFDTPCRTARSIAALLRRGGWAGQLRPCPDCLDVGSPST